MGDMFGKAWQRHRRRVKVTTLDLAGRLGVTDRYMRMVESGDAPPLTDERIVQACQVLGTRDAAYWQGMAAFDRAFEALPAMDPHVLSAFRALAQAHLDGTLTKAQTGRVVNVILKVT